MIKNTKRIISIILSLMLVISCCSALIFTTNAATTEENETSATALPSKYGTNPGNKVGVKKTITIDGSFSDWTDDMLIAQGAAWDVANHWKGGHENCVLDTYSLYGAWDDSNLYVAWQMVNTTDTWAREGDGPLSDGGRVLDVPLILALSIDPNSVSMSNKNTDGGSIWGQKMGITFETHVDRLLYMSGKAGNGEPGLFKAVDAQGNTNYKEGLTGFKAGGIEYKMAEGCLPSSIIGLNSSNSPDDVFSESSDWVDYKTFKGSSGTHNTKYDSFYEIKIPLATLGIDASYLENNGIGAMLLATRGESALDCIPFDPSMLDNVSDSYGSDPSTSHEKDDIDNITVPFARIGNLGSTQPTQPTQPATTQPVTTQPVTTQPATTQPATEPATTQPTPTQPVTEPGNSLTVNASSNISNTATTKLDSSAKTVTVTYNLQSSKKILDGQYEITYDSSKLKISDSCYDEDKNLCIMPVVDKKGGAVVNGKTAGTIIGNFTNIATYDFTTESPFVEITFDVIGTGTANVNLNLKELDAKNQEILIYHSALQDAFNNACTSKTDVTGSTTDTLTVNATSNIANAATKVFNPEDNSVKVTYNLQSSKKILDGQFKLTYDSSKLKVSESCFNEDGNLSIMPVVSKKGGDVVVLSSLGNIGGSFTNLSLYDFTTKGALVEITFDIIGTGTADVNLDLKELDAKNKEILVYHSVPQDAFNSACTTETLLDVPSPLEDNQVKVIGKSNIADTVSKIYTTDNDKKLTATFYITSAQKFSASQWQLTYDPSVLKLSDSNYDSSGNLKVMPVADTVGNSVANLPAAGRLTGNFVGSTNVFNFTSEGAYVQVDFDIIGKATTTSINLNVDILSYIQNTSDIVNMIMDGNATDKYNLTSRTVLSEPTEPTDMMGDVNLDGKVNIFDATIIQLYIAEAEKLSPRQLAVADVNRDGKVNIFDATAIQLKIAEIISDFTD